MALQNLATIREARGDIDGAIAVREEYMAELWLDAVTDGRRLEISALKSGDHALWLLRMGRPAMALRHARAAVDAYRALAADNSLYGLQLARALVNLAIPLANVGLTPAGISSVREALALWEDLDPSLAEGARDDVEWAQTLLADLLA